MRSRQAKGTNANLKSSGPIEGPSFGRSIRELEELRLLAAKWVVEYGPRYGFILERMEKIVASAKGEEVTARALRLLAEADSATVSPGAPAQEEQELPHAPLHLSRIEEP